ncbi:hypothetical protein KCG48_10500 [Proteiniclasticum sp. BAD-10]|uniref:Uncharacterized protein n=1 Tax=Proteiniclasticum sediminis TaxID=2804028 RepID=A0A941HRZ1_9CLOT|nr:hypothetical protein [Proteiniclasticum sediminis]MBR0576762.1 hypothetical protein [Proteiniclasticum sediminis]
MEQSQNKSTSTKDKCTTCPWLDRQPEGNQMLCILPGDCFWMKSWYDNPKNETQKME